MISATITFNPGESERTFTPRRDPGNPWRFIGDTFAADLTPICYLQAQALQAGEAPPLFDRVEIWPVRWGIPDSLVTDHPAEVEEIRRKFYARKPEAEQAEWDAWLEQVGKRQLWWEFRTPELERHWLSSAGGAGRELFLHARKRHFTNPLNVGLRALERIQFRADFWLGDYGTTIYLSACLETPLTPDEYRTSPAFQAQEEATLQAQRKMEAQKAQTETLRAANIKAESATVRQQQANAKATKSTTQQRRDRKKRQDAGAATFQLRGYEEAAMQLIRYMSDFRNKERKAGRKYGAVKAAMVAGRKWWTDNHTDPASKAALSKAKVSDSALRRWIDKTPLWLKSRRHEK